MSEPESAEGLPRREATINRLVGYNLRWFRERLGLTQTEFGQRMGGWSKVVVSAAERSWTSDRVRQFTADELLAIAGVLGVPVIALLLPPPDSGTKVEYAFMAGATRLDANGLLDLVVADYQGGGVGMTAFRDRLAALGGDHLAGSASQSFAARLDAEQILNEARSLAVNITNASRSRAKDLERDAQEKHRQAMRDLIPAREELERRVEDLRMFEREYRSRLLAYLKGQVADLEAGARDTEVFPAVSTGALLLGEGPALLYGYRQRPQRAGESEAGENR